MTLDGTNTWLLAEPGARRAVVVDPGPDDPAHLRVVLAEADRRDLRVATVLLTHGHPDHAAGARAFGELAGAPVRALDPAHRLGPEGLVGGDVVACDGLEVRVVATPGHTADSLSFLLPADAALLTGDTILGRGTTVVVHPEGRLADYLDSLRTLRGLAERHEARTVLPGHGPVLDDALATIDGYLAHRQQRLAEVREAVRALGGDPTTADPTAVTRAVYTDVDPAVLPFAELSVRAQLVYLAENES
jgi:glyoxylase-like metal-dependent hydrolase (beta-lactamase superfamily II)